MTNTAAETISEFYAASETLGAPGAFGRELGETGFSTVGGYGSGSLSLTERAEWDALHAAEAAVYTAHGVETCECCGPILTEEGEAEMDRIRSTLTPRWYLRRSGRWAD